WKRGRIYWIKYRRNGRPYFESTHLRVCDENRKAAARLLKEREGTVVLGWRSLPRWAAVTPTGDHASGCPPVRRNGRRRARSQAQAGQLGVVVIVIAREPCHGERRGTGREVGVDDEIEVPRSGHG